MIDHENYAHGTPDANRARIFKLACYSVTQAENVMLCCELSDDAATANGIRRLQAYTKAMISEVLDLLEQTGRAK